VLQGKPPPEQELKTNGDPLCGRSKFQPLKTRFYVVGRDGGLADAVVSIKAGLSANEFPASTNLVDVQFTNCEARPYMVAVQTGHGVRFKSADRRTHRFQIDPVHNKSRTSQLNMANSVRVGFPDPELFVPITCVTHPWETAFISVFDHPYFAVTDGEGRFSIPNVPPGNYVLQIVHRQATGTNAVLQTVSVSAGKRTERTIMLEVPREERVLSRLDGR
jgi:hypothetical protein